MIRLLAGPDVSMVLEYLERNHMETTFQIGNVQGFGLENNKSSRRCGDYYGYFEDGKLRGLLSFYNLGSVMPHLESLGGVSGFVDLIRSRKFETLVGMKHTVEPIYRAILHCKQVLLYEDSYYLVNRRFQPFASPRSGQIAAAGAVDQTAALKFIVEAYRQGFKRRFHPDNAAKMLTEMAGEEDFVFMTEEDRLVALAAIQTTTDRINQIGGVYTSEESRGKGYCKALVSELCQRIMARGKTPTLMVRKDNIPAVKAYQSVGFEYFTDYLLIKFVV